MLLHHSLVAAAGEAAHAQACTPPATPPPKLQHWRQRCYVLPGSALHLAVLASCYGCTGGTPAANKPACMTYDNHVPSAVCLPTHGTYLHKTPASDKAQHTLDITRGHMGSHACIVGVSSSTTDGQACSNRYNKKVLRPSHTVWRRWTCHTSQQSKLTWNVTNHHANVVNDVHCSNNASSPSSQTHPASCAG